MNQYIIITTTFDNKDELDKVSKWSQSTKSKSRIC